MPDSGDPHILTIQREEKRLNFEERWKDNSFVPLALGSFDGAENENVEASRRGLIGKLATYKVLDYARGGIENKEALVVCMLLSNAGM